MPHEGPLQTGRVENAKYYRGLDGTWKARAVGRISYGDTLHRDAEKQPRR